MTFNSDEYYTPDDSALRIIATAGTLAVWRCHRRGPKYFKFGKRILYLGSRPERLVCRAPCGYDRRLNQKARRSGLSSGCGRRRTVLSGPTNVRILSDAATRKGCHAKGIVSRVKNATASFH